MSASQKREVDVHLEIDQNQFDKAVNRMRGLIGGDEQGIRDLLKAFLKASTERTLLRLTENTVGPTTVAATRAEDLYFVCKTAQRILTEREIEVLYRVTPSSARSLLANMRAAYESDLAEQFATRMRNDVRVRSTGTKADGLTYTIYFADLNSMRTAVTLLNQAGLGREIEESTGRRSITFPREITVGQRKVNPLDILGLHAPK